MSKLHTEKRIKAVDTTQAENNPSNFEDGDIVYDEDGGGGFKKKLGGVGGGSFSPLPAGDLSGLGDVDLAGISAADIGDQLTYSYTDPSKVITWRTGTTIRIDMVKAGKRGYDGNVVAITFVNDAGVAAGAASYDGAGNGTLQITYSNTVTTATQIKTAIDGVSDFTATITGTASHTANSGDGGLGNTSFQDGFTGWKPDSPGTGVAPTNLTYDAGTRTIASSTGVDAALPHAAAGGDSGLMSGADKTKLDGISAGAEVNVQSNWNETNNSNDAFIQNKPTLVTNLNSVTNVNAPSPAAGDILEYDAGNSEWINAQPAPNDKIEKLNTKVEVTDGGTDGTIEFHTEGSRRWTISPAGHLLPDANNTYDIGSATYKVRDLYVDDSSIWVGDEHKISISGGQMKFRRRKNNVLPAPIQAAGGTLSAALTHAGKSNATDMKLRHWLAYMRTLSGQANATITDIFRPGTASDWDSDTDSRGDWTNLLNKPTIPSGNQIIDWTTSQGSDIHADNYTNTTYSIGDGGLTQNNFTNTLKSKLDGIEESATADQTASEIRALVESATNSNVFTDADHTKLNGIADNAQVNVPTNLTYTTATRTVNSSTGNNVQLPEVTTSQPGLMSSADKTKLNGIDTGAEVNVQADWNQSDSNHDAYINNKPTMLETFGTPSADQLAVWNNSTRVEGDDNLTWNSGTKEFKVGFDSDDYHIFKRTSSSLEISTNHGVHSHLLVSDSHADLKRTGSNCAFSGDPDTNAFSGRFLATRQMASNNGHSTIVPWTYRYHEMNNTNEELRITVSSAISTQTTVDTYFQMQTSLLESTDLLTISFHNAANAEIAFNARIWRDPGNGGNFQERVNESAVGSFDVFPAATSGSNSLNCPDGDTVWYKLRITEQGSSDLDDLVYIKFDMGTSAAGEDVRIANFHLANGDQDNDKAISVHEGGFLHIHRPVNKEYLEDSHSIQKGGFLYVNDFGNLGFKSRYVDADLIQKDYSWCGGLPDFDTATARFIPVNGTTWDPAPEHGYHYKILMRDAVFKKLILKTSTDRGTTTVRIYKNDTQIKFLSFDWESDGSINTSFDWKLVARFYDDCTFSEGDAISISIDTSNSGDGGDIIFATEIWYTS